MLFNSIGFLLFFPAVVFIYFALGHRWRWLFLLAASCFFYAILIPSYLFILFGLMVIDYTAAICIHRSVGRKRKTILLVSILSTCMMLVLFKYFNFLSYNVSQLAALLHWNYTAPLLDLVLPLGLSFHTFQSLSYVIEVYKGRQEPERHLGIYALYVMFFPQLVAGPIERPQNMLYQFHEQHQLNYARVVSGLQQMLLGYFKKMVIADNLSPYVDMVYKDPSGSSGNMIIATVFFFAIQIYCDFSGYSDIAIGAARIMGFDMMRNFKFPYFSRSFTSFWRRWHISLSTWFRDYIYIPLGGSLAGSARLYYNIAMVFLLSALWHGAGWTFIVWGLLHAMYMILENATGTYRNTLLQRLGVSPDDTFLKTTGILITFSLTCFAWIFFRAADVNNALDIIKGMSFNATTFMSDMYALGHRVHLVFPERIPMLYVMCTLVVFLFTEYIQYRGLTVKLLHESPRYIRWGIYYCLLSVIVLFGVYDVTPNFIYFQF